MTDTIKIEKVTRWYGQVIGVNNVSLRIRPGVTGLLGPNGAGKSTLMKLMTGQILPNQGEVEVLGVKPFFHYRVMERVGFVPEHDALPDQETGRVFLRKRALLRGYSAREAQTLAVDALCKAGLAEAASKKVGAYSKGMRQRLKLAQAVFHDPEVIILDEPLTGLDPVGRRQVIDQVKTLGREGRTVLVSSHVLHEIELMTDQVILIVRGKVLAEGTIEHIRSLIDAHPHTVDIVTPTPLELGTVLLKTGCLVSLSLEEGERMLRVRTREPDKFYDILGDLVVREDFEVERFHSPDNNLQAVFDYLVK
jgi:ABC-2 type transport system ATP-binding protein